MSNNIYPINKGINKSIEFKGLKAQYIWYLGGGIVLLMAVFAGLYILGLPSLLCMAILGITGTAFVMKVYSLSHKYGEYGMMKALARRQLPRAVKMYSRKVFCAQEKIKE
ncbi:DUF4133 domain-containing protein [Flavobacterium macacae]|uniref:DUF4133 domain-containing protein n=1 Tax=Flavobacterium macacae TaxID=2488993 RepID=A0A3P3W9P3_9FLAO|nr:DUF4133 domain-containing protein [Flavobacterium macacae]RRJ90726.1 DUF4133 domain-containing protein [Flavobacterium macacae]